MPVIRGEPVVSVITADHRRNVTSRLANELGGETTPLGPVIFEIPFEPPDTFDVLVVWDAWEPFTSEERSSVIREVYDGRSLKIAQALGVTYQEAIERQLLPYAVIPMVRPGEIDSVSLKDAIIAEGGFALANGKVDLRFPTMALAEQAHRRLSDRLRNGYWSIVQTSGSLP